MMLPGAILRRVTALVALIIAPAAASAQDWVAVGVCTAINFEAVTFSDPENAFTVGGGNLVHSGDGGRSWAPLLAVKRPLHDVGFRGALGLAVGDGGLILRTTDGGQSWSEVESNAAIDLRTVALGDGGFAVAAGFDATLRSLDGGATWSIADAGDFSFLLGSAASGTSRAWIVGAGGIVRGTTDGGSSWQTQPSGTTQDLRGTFFISPSRGWIAGAGGTLLYTEDGGATWTPRGKGIGASLNALHFVSPSIGWVVGSGGAILRTEDAGLSWVAESAFNADELFDVSFSPAGQGCAVGVECRVLLRSSPVTAVFNAIRPERLAVRPLANPVRAVATLRFGVPRDGLVRLGVFDVQGRLAAKLVDARLPAGWHEARWNAAGLAPGIYLARIEAGGASASAKVVLRQ